MSDLGHENPKKSEEKFIVFETDTVIQPNTMMIKNINTPIADEAVLRSISHISITCFAVEIEIQTFVSLIGFSVSVGKFAKFSFRKHVDICWVER